MHCIRVKMHVQINDVWFCFPFLLLLFRHHFHLWCDRDHFHILVNKNWISLKHFQRKLYRIRIDYIDQSTKRSPNKIIEFNWMHQVLFFYRIHCVFRCCRCCWWWIEQKENEKKRSTLIYPLWNAISGNALLSPSLSLCLNCAERIMNVTEE